MCSGSLLRMFQSELFDANMHMLYLQKMAQSGVQDYLVNELYRMPDEAVDFYLPQLCQLALQRFGSSSLTRFLLDKAAQSMHFALRIHWLLQSLDREREPELAERAASMLTMCEAALVNCPSSSSSRTTCAKAPAPPPPGGSAATPAGGPRRSRAGSHPAPVRPRSGEEAAAEGKPAAPLQPRSAPVACWLGPKSSTAARSGAAASAGGGRARSAEPSGRRGSAQEEEEEAPGLRTAALAPFAAPPSAAEAAEEERLRVAAVERLLQLCPGEGRMPPATGKAAPPSAYAELGDPIATAAAVLLAPGGGARDAEGNMRMVMEKRRRCDYFNTQNEFVAMIMKLSGALVSVSDAAERYACMDATLGTLNGWLLERRVCMAFDRAGPRALLGVHVPCQRTDQGCELGRRQLLRLHARQCRIFNSATRAPFLLVFETADLDGLGEAASAEELSRCVNAELQQAATSSEEGSSGTSSRQALRARIADMTREQWKAVTASSPAWAAEKRARKEEAAQASASSGASAPAASSSGHGTWAARRSALASQVRRRVWGELWKDRRERVRKASPYGHLESWELNAVVVKGGDDLRQELLASQVIHQLSEVFREAGLPLWLQATKVVVVSAHSGFIEFVRDSTSIDGLKKQYPGKTLAEIFRVAFGDRLFDATRCFIESFAAYALVVWLLQVKDRHNGNLLLDADGHMIHIDFGFMLSNSPGGNMAFEQAPFKLTQEFVDVMGGETSEQFDYFRTLLIRGFLEARKHAERVTLPIKLLAGGWKLPCFRDGGDAVLRALQDRFFLNVTEEVAIDRAADLIDQSLNNWRTVQYDNYQRLVNGIL